MPIFLQILALIGGLLVLAMVAEAWIKRGSPKRSLAEKFKPGYDPEQENEKPELGMEATDMNAIRLSERGNRSAEAFGSRDLGFWSSRSAKKRRAKVAPTTDTPKGINK